MRKSSGGAGAPGSALNGANVRVSQKNNGEEVDLAALDNLAMLDFETAGVALPDDGPRRCSQHSLSSVSFDMTPAAARGGFKAALRHTARVRWLRRVAIAGSLLAITLIATAALLNPLRRLPGELSIGRVGVEGTKVTVESPKITGAQKDGSPFEIKAHSGIQDITTPDIIELLGIDSKIGAADASITSVNAARGVYDSLHDKMTLEGDIRIKSSTGYDVRLKTARIDFKTGGLVSEEPVKVLLDGGTITAQHINVSDNGHKVSFDGDVTSWIDTGAGISDAASTLTESIR
jgi:lipopolysaccharide export system protein LptC